MPYSVLAVTGSLLVSDTRTWGACAWFLTAVAFAFGVGWVVAVTTGLCGDQPGAAHPELLQFDQRGFNLCAFKHAKIYPDWPSLLICAIIIFASFFDCEWCFVLDARESRRCFF